ncbi:PBP1A family penicillin-binding protein [bacterium]|nr:PBP1A family penicillin-binding protein [bacterium]
MSSLFYKYSSDLPKLDSLKDYNPPVVSEVFSDNGTKIGEFWTEKRYLLSPKELPKTIVEAIVAGEDDRFFEHQGLDYYGIFRAFLENLRAGHVVQGGSTITQQVTKSLLLTRERSIERKVKEAILATKIEKSFSKNEILYLYLNQTFFGNRAYGIEAAARNYFNKSAKELNIAEAAMIAGLAKAPSSYSPIVKPELAKQRQEYVIDRMYTVGYITEEQAKKAKAYPIKVSVAKTDKEFNYQYAPWFTEYVRTYLQKTYGEESPYTEGFKIYTTLNIDNQKAADMAVTRGLRELDKRQGYQGPRQQLQESEIKKFLDDEHVKLAKEEFYNEPFFENPSQVNFLNRSFRLNENQDYDAVITNVSSDGLTVSVANLEGKILPADYAWARSRPYRFAGSNIGKQHGKTLFSRGDVVWVRLKSGSGTTPLFTLEQDPEVEAALYSYDQYTGYIKAIVGGKDFKKSEFNRATQSLRQTGSVFKPMLYAAALDKGYKPDTVIDDSPVYYEYSPGRFWSPQNYGGGYKGPTSFRSALVNSRNVVSVKILMDIGTDFTTGYLRKLGIETPIKRYYSMALGANDMKLADVSRAFGVFPTGGILPNTVAITRMTDRYNRVREQFEPRKIVPYSQQLEAHKNAKASGDFNKPLLEAGEKWIKDDKLSINDIEKKILYGSYIPEGYTISPKTAYTMVSIMSDIVNFGTGYKVKELKRPAAGKTGTTNDETDTWFVGYTPELFAGVWVGFDQVKKIGSGETGGHTAAPIFLYYMQEALKGLPIKQFDIPKDINDASLMAPLDTSAGDAEAGGVGTPGDGAEFFIYDF